MGRKLSLPVLLVVTILSFTGSAYAQAATEETKDRFPPWAWIVIILAFLAFAFIVFWWWLRPRREERRGPTVQAPVPAVKPPEVESRTPAVKIEEPRVDVQAPPKPATPDDLKIIEGIGPKIASVLQAAGIQTFAQLAASNVDQIRQILGAADPRLLRLADPASWPEQARHAAAGDMEALRKLQDALKGGRQV